MSTYTGMSLNTVTSAYWIYKGTSSVEAINKATPKIGYTYTLTDAGKITNGNIDVVKGDVICYLNGGWILVTEGNLGAVVTALNKQVQGIDTELSGTRQDLTNRINNTDKALADYKDEMVTAQARQDGEIAKRLTISTYDTDKTAQGQKDREQDEAIAELQKHKQVNSDWTATSGVAQILNKPTLAKVATSGSYKDLTDKPTPVSPTSECVPYSADLDGISDDLGVAWMNVGEGREFGHIYRKEQGEGEKQKVAVISQDHGTIKKGTYRIIEDCPNVFTGITYAYGYPFCIGKLPYTNDQKSEVLLKVGDIALVTATKEYEPITDLTIKFYEFSQTYSITDMTVGGSKSNVGFQVNSLGSYKLQNENGDVIYTDHALKLGVFGNDLYLASDGNYYVNGYCLDRLGLSSVQEISPMEWKDVYDTSTITADITAEVQRATQAESALSTRIDTKADASTWSASLKNQIDTDHTTLSGLSAKWTDILKSQIDADHTTLGNLNTYLSEAKRTGIDDAIAKAHQQNTDTMLASGVVSVTTNNVNINSRRLVVANSGVTAIGEVSAYNETHKLSEKLNSSMQRTFATTEDLIADMANIPNGAWCAIINTHSGGVSAQSDDDIIE